MDLHFRYPIGIENDYAIWRAFHNQFWPAHTFIDAAGRIRGHQFGEGDFAGSERTTQKLLVETGRTAVPAGVVTVAAGGAEPVSDGVTVGSCETYIG